MNPNNPLLGRLFETRSAKKKRKNNQSGDEISNRDKILIPKLNKNVGEMGINSLVERQKTGLLKPNMIKLPPLSQKQLPATLKQIGTSSSKKVGFRQRKVSWHNQTHDISVFPTQLRLGTPLHQQKYEQQTFFYEKVEKQPPKKFKTVIVQPDNEKAQQQLFEYLKIIDKNEELKEEFCYMNRGELPYSYHIVDYKDVNKKQFLTVSLRGVSIYKDGQSEFTTVGKLAREIQLYRKIKKIQFFNQYIIEKVMKHWRIKTVRRKFQTQCRIASKIILSQNLIVQKYMQFLFNLTEDFVKCKFLDIRFSKTGSLEDLKNQLKNKEQIIEKSIQFFENEIQKNLKQTISVNLVKFRQEERVSLTSDGKDTGEQAYLPYDTKKRSMKYTQMAKLKQFQATMYRLLKMTDLVRFTTKNNMIIDGLENFAFEMNVIRQKYLKRKQISFVSWANMKISIKKISKHGPVHSTFECIPTLQQIQQVLEVHLKNILDKFYKKHFLLIDKKNEYHCESFDPPSSEVPSKIDFKIYVQQNKEANALRNLCYQKMDLCLNDVRAHLQKGQQNLLRIYNESFMTKDVNYYMENQPLRAYLVSMAVSRQILNSWQPIIEFGIVYLDMSDALAMAKQKFEEKFKYISNAIPIEMVKRCQSLATKIREIYNMFKENPSTIMEFIRFFKNYNEHKKKIQQLQKKIEQILDLQEMVYKNGLKIGQGSKIHINQCSTYYRELQKRFDEIETNEEKDRKKFYKMIDDMVEPLDVKSQQLYKKIYEDSLVSSSQSNTQKCMQKLMIYEQQFKKLRDKKEELFYYQNQLKLGNKDLPNYFKLESSLEWTIKIWKGRQKYEQFLSHIKTKGYAQKINLSINQLKIFLRDLQAAQSQIEFVELLQNFKQDALKALNIIELCRLLSADTLQDEHKKTIKDHLVTENKKIKDYLFTIEGGRTILCIQLITDTNLIEIKDLLEQIVHASAQQNIIKKHIQQVEEFWRKNRIAIVASDLAKNGTEILHFGRHENEKLQQKIGTYLMLFKNILGSKHSVGQLNNRVLQQIKICEYLKKLIQKWIEVQKQWIKLLPLMTNCPSVKHQSNVYFQFTSVDNHLRKHNRQVHDLTSVKKISEDYLEKRYLTLMDNCDRELVEVNKIFNNFLEMKRNTYHRFFFLADQELVNILENTKDGKTLAKYASYCFNCDRLVLDKELISGFQTSYQILKLRKGILKGQPDEMFKSVQQNMKSSLKSTIITLIPKMKIGMNIDQQHENPLQAVLVADKFLWTEMTEHYLNPTSYESYELFIRRHCEQLVKYVKKPDLTPQQRHKISVRLVQAMGLRQIGEEMIKLQVTKQDFKWKEQLKYTLEEDQITITQFNRKMLYGLQYYPPSKITVPTNNYRILLSRVNETCLTNKVLVVTGVEGDGKRNLMYSCAQQFGCFYKELVCNKNISFTYLLRFVQGAILAGAWLSLYEFQHLQSHVLVKVLNEIKKVVSRINKNEQIPNVNELSPATNENNSPIPVEAPLLRIPNNNIFFSPSQKTVIRTTNRVMFNFITHGFYPEKVSVYKFDTFTLSEPNHKKICEWLLQVNNFTQWQHLSARLIIFLQTVFPFLQRVMGSFMSILRKVIDSATQKKKQYSYSHKETEIIAQAFKQEILDKSDENIHGILYQALHNYFFIEIPEEYELGVEKKTKSRSPRSKQSFLFDTKLNVICSLINKNTRNILVIGPRTNKSKLIRQACLSTGRQILSIYPQSTDYFFHDQTIEKLNKLDQKQIIHYDGESIMRQWSDLVISGYLLMEGKKIRLNNQLIIELREVNDCSPSFVGSCQIVYIGNTLTKKQRFMQRSQAQDCELIMEPMTQIFGDELENLPDHLLEVFAQFFKPYAKDPRSKNYHKLIVWLGNVMGMEGLWNKYYAGRFYDVTVSKNSQQLTPIDQSKYQYIEEQPIESVTKHKLTMGNLLVHTKSTILMFELFRNLMHLSLPVLFTGKHDSGKSTLLKLLFSNLTALSSHSNSKNKLGKSFGGIIQQKKFDQNYQTDNEKQQQQDSSQVLKINLNVKYKTKDWSKILKSSLTNIRREGKNFLMNVGDNDIFVTIDDLDLGFESHREYLRQLIDLRSLHDTRFEQYTIQKIKVVVSWLKNKTESLKSENKSIMSSSTESNYKLFDRMVELQIPQFARQSLATIVRTNIDSFIKKNNISKEVINVIDNNIIKCLLVAFDDITNVNGPNVAAGIMMGVMRNFISLPRKNVLMPAQNYINFFKIQLKERILEKCLTPKNVWQGKAIYENLARVLLNNLQLKSQQGQPGLILKKPSTEGQLQDQQEQSILVFQEKMYKTQLLSKLKQKISAAFPHLYIFDDMIKMIVKINNQMHSNDRNCILVGRTGTGKETILQIVAYLNKVQICNNKTDLSECIVQCLRGKEVILEESYLRRNFSKFIYNTIGTQYQKIDQCLNDEELEKLVTDENLKKEYNQIVAGIPGREVPQKETKVIRKVKQKLRSVIIFDTLLKYKEAISKYRELNRYYVCYIDDWPPEALLNISGVNITRNQLSEQIKNAKQSDSPIKYLQIDLPHLLAQVFTNTNRIMQNFDESSISIKRFKVYIKVFERMYQTRYNELFSKITFYNKIYLKFHDACTLITDWERRVDILKIQLEEAIKKLDEELRANRLETITFSILYNRREIEEQILAEKNQEMAEIKKQMQKKLQGMKKVMDNIEKIVNSMQRTEMSELKKIYRSSKIVSFGLECLCLLLGQQPLEKSVNKILADPNLMMKMKSSSTLQNRNVRIVQKFKSQFDTIKQEYETKSRGEASRALIDWIKSILEYWNVLGQHQVLSGQHKKHKKTYEESLERQREIEISIRQLKEKTIQLDESFEALFQKKQQNLKQYNTINHKLKNAKKILPVMKNSEEQTWEYIKQLRGNLTALIGNLILAITCLIYLPLKRLRLKKEVLADLKKLMNQKLIVYNHDFMSAICGVQDALLEDLNLIAIKQLEEFPVLIVDPERRAMSYLFDQDPYLAITVVSKNFSDLSNSIDILAEIQKNKKKQELLQQNAEDTQKDKNLPIQENQMLQQSLIDDEKRYSRKNPILHTTDENYKFLMQKLPEQTFLIDWKFTTIDTNQKIFLRLAASKRPEYFEAKRQLNRKIKKDIQKIEEYKREIYEIICSKQIKILDDQQFVELGIKLMKLQTETQKNKQLQKQKVQQIREYAKEINQEVTKVIFMVNALKKIKNVALDLILNIACSEGNSLQNIVKWVLAIISPNKRLGWLLAIAMDYAGQTNEELLSILIKDTPLKINQISRQKKPTQLSSKNYENLCKLACYTANLKTFSESVLRNAKQFELWTFDNMETIPQTFKPQILTFLEQLTIIKIIKPKVLVPVIKRYIKNTLKIQILEGYSNKQLLLRTNKKFPIIVRSSIQTLQKLCEKLNNSKLTFKSLGEITDSLQMKKFLWAQMNQGNWVVLHSLFDRNTRQTLEDIIQYVSNYEQQQNFRIFVYIDQIELAGYENTNEITTKYNNISFQVSKNKRGLKTQEEVLIMQSKYIENIGIGMYEEAISFEKIVLEAFEALNIELPEVNVEAIPQSSSLLSPHTPFSAKNLTNKPNTPLNPSLIGSNISLNPIALTGVEKQKFYDEKIAILISILEVAAWTKFSKLKINKFKTINIIKYIKQYGVPLQFNLYAVAAYFGRMFSSPLQNSQRIDIQQLAERIIDETKLNDKVLYGIPITKQGIALALKGIGRAGINLGRNWLDQRIRNNDQLLGCQQSYTNTKNAYIAEHILETLGEIKFFNRSIKEEVADIRTALARLPANVLVFSRQVKNVIFLHCYMNQLKNHNRNIIAAREFLQWVNISSNQDLGQEDTIQAKEQFDSENEINTFTWSNLLKKVKQLTGSDSRPYKIRAVLSDWLQNLKRKHDALLYWNLDNPVLVLHPALLINFPMVASTYVIHYLSLNYQKIKTQCESTNTMPLYTLQIEFSRQTDQKQIYMTEGILLPDLIYKEFRYNFELKMLDQLQEWNGQESAPLIMLKMKKMPTASQLQINNKDKGNEDYQSPQIEIATRINGKIEVVYKIKTYIDGNFQEWPLRRPMLISE